MKSVLDVYASRHSDHPEIIDRRDPVVYSNGPGPLSPKQIAEYDEKGFLFLNDILPPDTFSTLKRESERMQQSYRGSSDPRVILEKDDMTLRSIFAVHREPVFDAFVEEAVLAKIARQILGSEVYVHQSRINFKSGFSGKDFYWHSDFETWHIEDGMPRMRALSFSIALTDNLPFNGPLMVIPGSHRHYITCVGETPKDHYLQSLRQQNYGTPDPDSLRWLTQRGGIEMPTGPAGSVLIFDCNVMHGSNSNITPYPRNNIFLVYNSVENRLKEPYGNTAPRPDFIATRP